MSENDSRPRVDWGSFYRNSFSFAAFSVFLGIAFKSVVLFFLPLIIGIIVAYFLAVEPNEDKSERESVRAQNGAIKREGQKSTEGGLWQLIFAQNGN